MLRKTYTCCRGSDRGENRVWAWLATWLVGSGEIPELSIGETLRCEGIRARSATVHASREARLSTRLMGTVRDGDPTYHIVARIIDCSTTQAIALDSSGITFLLDARALGAPAQQLTAALQSFRAGQLIDVVAQMEIVAPYEWSDFGLLNVQRDWVLRDILLVSRAKGRVGVAAVRATDLPTLCRAADFTSAGRFMVNLEPLKSRE